METGSLVWIRSDSTPIQTSAPTSPKSPRSPKSKPSTPLRRFFQKTISTDINDHTDIGGTDRIGGGENDLIEIVDEAKGQTATQVTSPQAIKDPSDSLLENIVWIAGEVESRTELPDEPTKDKVIISDKNGRKHEFM